MSRFYCILFTVTWIYYILFSVIADVFIISVICIMRQLNFRYLFLIELLI